jgi:hypothetical protein
MSDQSDGYDERDGQDVPTRVCPHCASISHTAGEYCLDCGKSYTKNARLSNRARIALIAGLVLLLLGGARAVFAIKHHQDEGKRDKVAQIAAARKKTERSEKAKRAAKAEKKLNRESEERKRQAAEKGLEKAIEADAKKLVAEEILNDPIIGASCDPVSGGSSTELRLATGSYDCIAITKRGAGGENSGYRFAGSIDFADGSFAYHLGG